MQRLAISIGNEWTGALNCPRQNAACLRMNPSKSMFSLEQLVAPRLISVWALHLNLRSMAKSCTRGARRAAAVGDVLNLRETLRTGLGVISLHLKFFCVEFSGNGSSFLK